MSLYKLHQTQFIPIPLEKAWDFFSSPANLTKITPPELGFVILDDSGQGRMFAGQIISYIIKPVLGIPVHWVTEITHVDEYRYFVDEQRFGPYSFWHHKHFFKEVPGGVEMTDLVHYKLPLGFLGSWAHAVFIRRKLESIFAFRRKWVEDSFRQ